MITDSDINNWFTYHAPDNKQQLQYQLIRDYAKHFANIILNNTKPCADQTDAIRTLRELVMKINQCIACNE